ncbi:MAG: M56 family metallopeptidase [Acidobacteriota bacterium]|nr:M56 family metallopeptidase [Acidobacteriota bacterium]
MIVLLIKVTLLIALALALQPFMRRSSAAVRHLVCAGALLGILLLPLSLLAPPGAGAFHIGAAAAAYRTVGAPGGSMRAYFDPRFWLWIWSAGAAFFLVRIATGYAVLQRLLRTATPLASDRAVPVFLADVSVPVVSGLLRPVVLLPRDAETWSGKQRSAALDHEFAHIARHDLWTGLAGHLACALYWFHPLVWVLSARSRYEQEAACDDSVLSAGFEPALYADALVAAARQLTSTRLIGCHMLTGKTFKTRVTRLFDGTISRMPSRTGIRGAAFASLIATVAIGLLVAAPQDDKVYRIGDGVSSPSVQYKVDPEYTTEAHDAKLQGAVVLSLVVGTDGKAHDINIVKHLGSGLDEKAVEAVQKWRFNPGQKDGHLVSVRAQIEINFRLK